MKTVILHGILAEKFGKVFKLDIASPAEAIRALCYMIEGFEDEIRKGAYNIVKKTLKKENCIEPEHLIFEYGKTSVFHIVPEVIGRKKGLGKAIIGALILITAFVIAGPAGLGTVAFAGVTYGTIAMIGLSIALAGISQMMAPKPKSKTDDQKASYVFNGPVNVVEQGNPVPLVYGKVRTGSAVISAGIGVDQLLTGYKGLDDDGGDGGKTKG